LLASADPGQLIDPQDKGKTDKKANDLPPIRIAAVGNKIFISCDDPFVLALANEVLRLMLTTGGDGDFESIHLKNANAAEMAKVFDQWFNGNKSATPQQQDPFAALRGRFGGGPGGFQMPQPAASDANKEPRIRVVADPTSNTLLVKASAVDMLTIRKMLNDVLDTGVADNVLMKDWIIPVKFA